MILHLKYLVFGKRTVPRQKLSENKSATGFFEILSDMPGSRPWHLQTHNMPAVIRVSDSAGFLYPDSIDIGGSVRR